MLANFVVVVSPAFDGRPGIAHRSEPVLVQTLIAESAIETLNEAVLHRLAWLDESKSDFVRVRPLLEDATDELRTVVTNNRLRIGA